MVLSQVIHPKVSTPRCSESNGFSAALTSTHAGWKACLHTAVCMPHPQKCNTGAVTPTANHCTCANRMQHKVQQTTHCDPIFNCTTCNPEVCSSAGCKAQHGSSSSSETSSSACACTTKSASSLVHNARHPALHIPQPVSQTDACRGTTGRQATATHQPPECGRAARLCATSIRKAALSTCSQAPESCRSLACPRQKSWVL